MYASLRPKTSSITTNTPCIYSTIEQVYSATYTNALRPITHTLATKEAHEPDIYTVSYKYPVLLETKNAMRIFPIFVSGVGCVCISFSLLVAEWSSQSVPCECCMGGCVAQRDTFLQLVVTSQLRNVYERRYFRKEVPGVMFLVAGGSSFDDMIGVPVENAYPPYKLNWRGWLSILSHADATWYMRCDADVALDIAMVRTALLAFDTDLPVYIGKAGAGRVEERRTLAIGNFSKTGFRVFAMGGCCETLNRKALEVLVANAENCADSTRNLVQGRAPSHDVEIGRCLHSAGVPLTRASWECGLSYPRTGKGVRQTTGITPCEIQSRDEPVVHPVKQPLAKVVYHNGPVPWQTDCGCTTSPAGTACATSCDNRYFKPDNCSIRDLPRCARPHSPRVPPSIRSLVLSLDGSVPDLPRPFYAVPTPAVDNRHGWRTPELTQGEVGLILSWKRMLRDELSHNTKVFAIFEDDAVHKKDIMLPAGCLFPILQDGFVLLGWSNWSEWLWEELLGDRPGEACVDVTPKTLGTFAVLLTSGAARKILWWIEKTNFTKPIDHVWGDLIQLNTHATALYPHMFTAVTIKTSNTNPDRKNAHLRAISSRWNP